MTGIHTSRSHVEIAFSAEGEVYAALAKVAGTMPSIPKDQHNAQQGFDFRSIGSIVAHAKPLLASHGLSIVPAGWELLDSGTITSQRGSTGYRMVVQGFWKISHTDGSYVVASMIGEAADYGDKATSKALQMAYKYLLTQMLGVASEDPDGASVSFVDEVPEAEIVERRVNAVKAAILEAANGDATGAKSAWLGLLDGLGYEEDEIDLNRIADIEKTWKERPL